MIHTIETNLSSPDTKDHIQIYILMCRVDELIFEYDYVLFIKSCYNK